MTTDKQPVAEATPSVPRWVTSWPDWYDLFGNTEVVPASDYEQLQRELTAAHEALKKAEADVVDLRAELAKEFTRRVAEQQRAEQAEAKAASARNEAIDEALQSPHFNDFQRSLLSALRRDDKGKGAC